MQPMQMGAAETVVRMIRSIGTGPSGMMVFPDRQPPGMTAQIVEDAWNVLLSEDGPWHGRGDVAYPWFMSQEDAEVLFPNGLDSNSREFSRPIAIKVLTWLADNKCTSVPRNVFMEITEQVVADERRKANAREMLGSQLIIDAEGNEGNLITAFRQIESAGQMSEGTVERILPLLTERPYLAWGVISGTAVAFDEHKDALMNGAKIVDVRLGVEEPIESFGLGDLLGQMESFFGGSLMPESVRNYLNDPSEENLAAAKADSEANGFNCGNPNCPTHGHLNRGAEGEEARA